MIVFAFYLLKVIICSGILFLYYHLALRNKLFHQWNRFYLLAAIIISLVVPAAEITISHLSAEETPKAIRLLQVLESADGYLEEITITSNQSTSTEEWGMLIYLLVSVILLTSVFLSIAKIISIIRSHTFQWIGKIKFTNTNVKGTPFSFFHFIFWNGEVDLQTQTGQQIFQHELVHVKEKHTFDKLFIQIILVAFWCNPFFWLIRRELKMIHEFIADKKAVGEHGTAALAAMILSASYPSQFNSMTNQFFQTSIKRRLVMLTKIQNPRINYLSRILALPILALTVLAFTLRTKTVTTIPAVQLEKEITVVIDAGHGKMPDGKYNGAVIDNVAEDDIVLAIANKVEGLNTNSQIKIVLTRPGEQIVDLRRRVEIAKENNADLFLSLHVNVDIPNSKNRSEKEMKTGFGVHISNKATRFQQQSEMLGSILREELNTVYATTPFLLKREVGVLVLDQNICPSVMVECGYLTNKKDKEFITNENNQIAIAKSILLAIQGYAVSMQKKPVNINVADTVPEQSINIIKSGESLFNVRGSRIGPLFILDGKEITEVEMKKIAAESIASVNVLKDKSATDKYGSKGANGVVEITSKLPGNDNALALRIPEPKPLIIVDGKEVSEAEFKKITPEAIESINVLKEKSAVDKYGSKGANGVIEIKLKKSLNETGKLTFKYENTTRDTVPKQSTQNKVKEIIIDGEKLRPDEVRVNKISWEQAKKSKQPVVVDGALKNSMNEVSLDESDINSVSIMQGLPVVRDYGDKAALGVVFITTKKYKSPAPSQ